MRSAALLLGWQLAVTAIGEEESHVAFRGHKSGLHPRVAAKLADAVRESGSGEFFSDEKLQLVFGERTEEEATSFLEIRRIRPIMTTRCITTRPTLLIVLYG